MTKNDNKITSFIFETFRGHKNSNQRPLVLKFPDFSLYLLLNFALKEKFTLVKI